MMRSRYILSNVQYAHQLLFIKLNVFVLGMISSSLVSLLNMECLLKKQVNLILRYLTVFMRTVMSVVTRVDKRRILNI
jgi:hypothetical protein